MRLAHGLPGHDQRTGLASPGTRLAPLSRPAGASSGLLTPWRRRPLGSSPSLVHVMTSGIPAHLRGDRPFGHSREPAPFRHPFHLRSLPLRRHYPASSVPTDLSATLTGPTRPSRAVRWRVPRHRQGFPCCDQSPLPHVPPPLPRRNRSVLASLASRPLAAFPVIQAGRLPRYPFRGLLGVQPRCGPCGR